MVAGHSLMMLRALRLLRLFRVFKLWRYTSASSLLRKSLQASRAKIVVFLLTVFIIVLIVWTLMYLIEWTAAWFDSIPTWVYWAIVTITTVWYGDITPLTPIGQLLSATLMILWYGIIAVPTWLVSAELVEAKHKQKEEEIKKKKKKKK
jgi:voltage-gated potassium channel